MPKSIVLSASILNKNTPFPIPEVFAIQELSDDEIQYIKDLSRSVRLMRVSSVDAPFKGGVWAALPFEDAEDMMDPLAFGLIDEHRVDIREPVVRVSKDSFYFEALTADGNILSVIRTPAIEIEKLDSEASGLSLCWV